MRFLTIFVAVCLLVSCSQHRAVTSQATNVKQNSIGKFKTSTKSTERLPKSVQTTSQNVKEFGLFALDRNSDKRDEKGWMIPPFKNAVIKAGFIDEPETGETVTVVPMQVELEPFQLAITGTTKTNYRSCFELSGCGEIKGNNFVWLTEFEIITDQKILEIEPLKNRRSQTPFGVFIIYPSVQIAKSLSKAQLTKKTLPENISAQRVEAAIDLDNDKKPDLLSVRFCCGDPNKESDQRCPYICQKYFKKTSGVWKVFRYADLRQ